MTQSNTPAIDIDVLADTVRRKLAAEPAIKEILDRYPALKEKRAYSLIADEYADAFMTNGDDIASAIRKAGEAVAEEFGLQCVEVGTTPNKHNRQAGRASGQSGTSDQGEEDYSGVIAELRSSRPGYR
jgi:hypothetical protein